MNVDSSKARFLEILAMHTLDPSHFPPPLPPTMETPSSPANSQFIHNTSCALSEETRKSFEAARAYVESLEEGDMISVRGLYADSQHAKSFVMCHHVIRGISFVFHNLDFDCHSQMDPIGAVRVDGFTAKYIALIGWGTGELVIPRK